MRTKQLLNLNLYFYLFILFFSLVGNKVFALSCPIQTTPDYEKAVIVGEITSVPLFTQFIEVWFEYGETTNYGSTTQIQTLNANPQYFCDTIYNLKPCTTYHQRPIAKFNMGILGSQTVIGNDVQFKTKCYPPSVDLKANGSDGPISIPYSERNNLILSWTSKNSFGCEAFKDWTGKRPLQGNENISLAEIREYNFVLKCVGGDSANILEATDSVSVILLPPEKPTVVTKGVILTY